MNLATLRSHRAQILAIADKYGAENVRVFGSVARGEATQTSDIDFLVTLRPRTSLLDLSGLYIALADFLKQKVDVVPDNAISPYIRDHVLHEATPL